MKSLHLDESWLRQKYEVEELSTYDIAAIVGRDPKSIYVKLKDFGIATRPRGHNLKGESEDSYMKRPGVINPFLGRKHSEETRRIIGEKTSGPRPNLRGARNGMKGRTGKSNPNYKDGSSPERQRIYVSGEWKEIVRQVYARDNYRCARCGTAHMVNNGFHAHHIKPWAGNEALRKDLNNLVTLHRSCHRWVHSRLNTKREFLA